MIMKIGPLPEACRTLTGGLPDAVDPGFHGVPAGPAHPDHEADGAGMT